VKAKDDLIAEKDAMVKAKDAMLNKTEVVLSKTEDMMAFRQSTALAQLALYRACLEPRCLIEVGLSLKYRNHPTLATKPVGVRLAEFVKQSMKQNNNLNSAAVHVLECIGCPKDDFGIVIADLQNMYGRMSSDIHRASISLPAKGWFCGGSTCTFANALTVKMLMDDPDVQASGSFPADEVGFVDRRGVLKRWLLRGVDPCDAACAVAEAPVTPPMTPP